MRKQIIQKSHPMKRVPSIGLLLVWLLLLSGSQLMAQRIAATDTCMNVTDPGKIGFDQVLCAPGNDPDPLVSLRPASGGKGELEYLWMYSETDRTFNGATFKPIPNSNSETYDPGPLFRTTVFARCVRRVGCPNFLEPEVVVITVENEARADIIGPTVVCSQDTITYELETNTPNPELIKWTFPTGVKVIENTGRTVTIAFSTYGQYNLSAMVTENGCTATGTKRIVATNNPVYCGMDQDPVVANFDYMDECGSLDVDFTNLSEGADRYEWWFDTSIDGDSVRSAATTPSFTYPAPGMYQVQLIAISNMGARDTIEKVIDVGNQFVDADFAYEYLGCGPNGIAINFNDNSTSSSPVIRREWTLKDGRSSTDDSPTFVFTREGVTSVTLLVENEEGCLDTLTSMVMITFPDSLTRNIPDTLVICQGTSETINLILDPQYSYQWSPTTGIDDPTSMRPVFSPEETTVYVLTAGLIGTGCTVTDTMVAFVPPPINLTVDIEGPVCAPDRALEANTDVDATITWTDTTGMVLATGPSYTPPLDTSLQIVVTATDEYGCTEMQTIDYENQPIETFPVEVDIEQTFLSCTGGQATFQFTDLSSPADQIETRAWVVSDGRDTIFGESPIISFAESGTYQVEAILTTFDGCVFRSLQTAEVKVPALDLPDTLLVCGGSAVQLGDPGAADPAFDYRWTPAIGLDDPAVAAPFAMPDETTLYQVTVTGTDSLGCTLTDSVLVIVTDSLDVSIDGDTVLCGAPIALSAVASAPATYQWFDIEGQLISGNQQVAVFPDSSTTYVVVATGLGSTCTASDTIRVANRAVDIEVVPAQDTLVACPGESIALTVTNLDPAQILTYTWSPDNLLLSQNGTAEPLFRVPDFAYTITGEVENQFGCTETITRYVEPALITDDIPDTVVACTGQNIELAPEANPEYIYSWSPPEGLSESTVNNPIFMGDTTTVYTVVITENISGLGCEVTREVVVVVGDTLDVRPLTSLPDALCAGDTLELEVGVFPSQQNVEITWYADEELTDSVGTGPQFSVLVREGFQTYFAFAQNPDGCQGIVRYAFEGSGPACRLPYVDTLCPGSPTVLLLACDPDAIGSLTYEWSDTTDLDLTDPDRPVATIFTPRTYELTITDTRTGCTQSGFVELNLFSEGRIDLGADTSICAPGDLTITAQTSGLDPNTLSWYSLEAPGTPLGFGESVTLPIMDTFQLVAETNTNDGCLIRDTIEIRVGDFLPPLRDTVVACPGEPVALNPGGDTNLEYSWSPADDLDLTDPGNPVATLQDDQTFQVTVTDPVRMCTITDEVYVDVQNESTLNAGPDQQVCALDSITLMADLQCVDDLRWEDQDGNLVGTGATVTVALEAGAQEFTVRGTTLTGAIVSDDVAIDNVVLDIALPDTIVACLGLPAPLNPERQGEGFDFRWSPITELDDPMAVNPSATLSMDQTFSVTVTDPVSGCTVIDTVAAVIVDEPTIDAGPDLTVCAGVSVTIEAQQQCLGLINWTDEAGNLLQIGSTLTIVPEEEINTYIVSGLSAIGAVVSDTVVVTVIGTQPDLPDQVLVCPDALTPLNPNPDLDISYEWSPATGLNDVNSPNPSVTTTEDQEYIVMTRDTNGCTFQDTVMVVVRDGLDPGAKTPDTTVCTTDPLDLSVRPDSGVTVTWYADAARTDLLTEGLDYTAELSEGRNVFYLHLEDAVCSITYEDSIVVTVNEFTIMLRDTVIACIGDPTPLNPDGPTEGVTYQWSPNTGINDPNAANPLVALTEDQSYMVTVTEAATGCVAMDTVFVNVLEEPSVSVGPDTSACVGENIILVAATQCADQVIWTDEDGMMVGEGPELTVTVSTGSVRYIAVATTNSGREARDTITVTGLGEPPVIVEMVTVCPNTPAALNPGADPDYTYEWSPATGLNDPNAPNPMVTASMDQTYSVTATGTNGCTFTDEVLVAVRDGLDPGNKSNDTTICAPETLTLFAEADTGVTINWYADAGLNQLLATGDSLDVNPVTGQNVYYFQGVDEVCSTTFTDSVVVTVLDFSVMLPDTVVVCLDEPTPLNPDPASPEFDYSWMPTLGLDDPTSASPTATLTDDQIYRVDITDPVTGCTTRETVVVNVQFEPSVRAGDDQFACSGDSVTLVADVSCANLVEWNLEDGTPVGTGLMVTTLPATGTNTYIVSALSNSGAVAFDTLVVEVSGNPPVVADSAFICAGQPVGINQGADSSYTYSWSPAGLLDDPGAPNPQATITADQLFMVGAVDANGCSYLDSVFVRIQPSATIEDITPDTLVCAGDLAILRVVTDPRNTVTWTDALPPAGTVLGGEVSLDIIPEPGRNVYYVTVRDTVCGTSAQDSVVVTSPDFSVTLLPDTLYSCAGVPVRLHPMADTTFGYEWSPADQLDDPFSGNPNAFVDSDQLFRVTITDPSGQCTYVDSTQVVYADLPVLSLQGDTVLCALEPLTIGAQGPAGINWSWSTERDFSNEITIDSAVTIAAEVGDRTFYVRGMDPVTGCFGIDSIQVSYRPVMADLVVLDVACVDGDTVRVRVDNQDTTQNLTYLWNPEDLLVGGDPLAGPQVTYRVEGMVLAEVELANQFGCTAVRTTELQPLNLNDQLTLEVEDSLLLPGESTTVNVIGCDDCAYEWFQDSVLIEGETESSILVSPDESIEIAVVVSKDGCLSDTLRVNITVSACEAPFVFVPSGFTPNGDGMNDLVRVFGEVILEEDFEFSIVARWGEEVYYSTDKDDQGWDGMHQGRELPPDVYAYVVQYRCAVDGELYLLKGNITLLR
jgi:gliding motility-associated-like protein